MNTADTETVEDQNSKKGRHRKKQLYSSILQQMEFYFSDSNLSKDRFLADLLKESDYVDLEVFLKFNKIRKLTLNLNDIQKAIGKSELIELSEDKTKVCRKKPIKVKENVDDCTIYVESIKADATHEWLISLFSEFGNVEYVSIPKYRHNKANKGFAFVEFETEKQAQNALDYFASVGCKMPSDTNPEELKSIATFEGDSKTKLNDFEDASINKDDYESQKEDPNTKNEDNSRKRKADIEIAPFEENNEKKMKLDIEDDKKDEMLPENITESEDVDKKKKKAKKDKKKSYIKELGLQVLSKKEWKKMRNRYLDLQRKKMREFKQYLHNIKYSQQVYNEKLKPPAASENNTKDEAENTDVLEKFQFVPGVVVKMTLPEPCPEAKQLKNEIKNASIDVKYVDIPIQACNQNVFIRFGNEESAKEFCAQNLMPGSKILLEGEEEQQYWEKILHERNIKFNKNVKKKRGRDKLLRKAEKQIAKANHIRFTDLENN